MENIALIASAGSGKTFSLSTRFVALCLIENINEILAITFTKKAANEMKERIINTFLNLENKENELNSICLILGKNKDEVIKLRDKKLENFLNVELKILTFDAFFGLILRLFSLELGISPDFTIDNKINELHKALFFKEISKDEELIDDLVEFLNYYDVDKNKIYEFLNTFYTLDIKIPSRFKKEPNFDEILKEFSSLKEKLQLNGLSNKTILNQFDKEKKDIFDILDTKFLQKSSFSEYKMKNFSPNFDLLLDSFKDKILNFIKDYEAKNFEKLKKPLEIFIKTRKDIIKIHNAFTFDDVSIMCLKLLNDENFSKDMFYFRLDSMIKHILIDEFQDTSIIQYKIIRPLIEEILSGNGQKDNRSLFYVGDKKQSIYSFRGGKKELFDKLSSDFTQIEKRALDTNYRSAKLIVDFVNSVFKDNQKAAMNFNINQEAINYLKDAPKELEINSNIKLNIDKNSFGYLKIATKDCTLIVDEVKVLLKKGASLANIAILVNKNKDALMLKDMLNLAGIKASVDINEELFSIKEIKAIINYLKFNFTKERIYYQNLINLIGFEPNITKLDISRSILENLNFICEILKINKSDYNILEFFEVAKEYKNLVELAFNNDQKLLNFKEFDGVKILTIHKSKGLEFNHVIVCDNLSANKNETSKFIHNYNFDKKEYDIFYRIKNREFIDKEYKNFKDSLNALEIDDIINRLYVAFSRAKKSLIIIKNNTDNKKIKSYFCGQDSVVELNDLEFGYFLADDVINKDVIETKKIELPKILAQNIKATKEIDIDYKASYFGSALHYSLEMLDNFDINSLEFALNLSKNRFMQFLDEDDFLDIKNRISNLLKDEKFNKILKSKKILKEQSFKIDNEIKRLDLLLEGDKEILILDYKSSKKDIDKNIEQVKTYKNNLLKFYDNKKVVGIIVFLKPDGIEFLYV